MLGRTGGVSLPCGTEAAPESWKVSDPWCLGSASLPEQRVSAVTCLAPSLGLEDSHQNAVTLEGKKQLSEMVLCVW